MIARCPAKYEPEAKAVNTHTCDKGEGHEGDHHCPRCGKDWPRASVYQQAMADAAQMWRDAFGTEP